MKDITKKISEFLIREKREFVLIGATARDLFLEQHDIAVIGTRDIDFAVVTDDWEQFEELKAKLIKEFNLIQDQRVYRLLWGGTPIDFLPFGKIEDGNFTIKWPNTFRERIKVMGFKEACQTAAEVDIDGVVTKVVIPEMLVALKLNSWSHDTGRVKDAIDIKCVLDNVAVLCRGLQSDTTLGAETLEESLATEKEKLILRLGLRIRKLLGPGSPLDYLENVVDGEGNRRILARHMNNDSIPSAELFQDLSKMLSSLRIGIKGRI
jgi:predicted nucleotidyltransferase